MSTYLGQNFLHDQNIITFIRRKAEEYVKAGKLQTIIEIGPGKGAISKSLSSLTNHFFAIEKDPQMLPLLQENIPTATIIHKDILDIDLEHFIQQQGLSVLDTLVLGNLPYYITSPILRKIFTQGTIGFPKGLFMVQAEVGEKIQTEAKKKSYLRWLLNRGHEVIYLKTVPTKAFTPAPKVKSCLISITKKDPPRTITFSELLTFLEQVTPYSRKTLGKIAKIQQKKGIVTREIPEILKGKRLEECSRKELSTIFQK